MNLLVRPRVKPPDKRLISNPEVFGSLFPSLPLGDFRCYVTCQACRDKSHYRAIALGSKPPLVTRIAPTGLGRRLSFLDVSVRTGQTFRCPECQHLCLGVRSLGCS